MKITSAISEPTLTAGTAASNPQLLLNVLWPIDKLFIAYAAITGLLLTLAVWRDPSVLLIILGHITVIGLIFLVSRYSSGIVLFLRHWYLLAYVPLCYKEIPYMVTKLGLRNADSILAHWDRAMWKTDPVFWLGVIQSRALTEFLQIIYSMFIPGMAALGVLYWYRKSRADFRHAGFLIAATFLISYLGYLVLPARGPRFMDYSSQYPALQGLWTFHFLQGTLDSLEGAQYDCFPSGHVAVILVGCYLSRRVSPRVFWVSCVFASLITFSTVYLRYHYVIDVLAGMLLAMVLMIFSKSIYNKLSLIQGRLERAF